MLTGIVVIVSALAAAFLIYCWSILFWIGRHWTLNP